MFDEDKLRICWGWPKSKLSRDRWKCTKTTKFHFCVFSQGRCSTSTGTRPRRTSPRSLSLSTRVSLHTMAGTTSTSLLKSFKTQSRTCPGLVTTFHWFGRVFFEKQDFLFFFLECLHISAKTSKKTSPVNFGQKLVKGPSIKCASSFLALFDPSPSARMCTHANPPPSISMLARPILPPYPSSISFRVLFLKLF